MSLTKFESADFVIEFSVPNACQSYYYYYYYLLLISMRNNVISINTNITNTLCVDLIPTRCLIIIIIIITIITCY